MLWKKTNEGRKIKNARVVLKDRAAYSLGRSGKAGLSERTPFKAKRDKLKFFSINI